MVVKSFGETGEPLAEQCSMPSRVGFFHCSLLQQSTLISGHIWLARFEQISLLDAQLLQKDILLQSEDASIQSLRKSCLSR